MHKRVFIIDDEPDMIKIATDLLQSEGYIVNSDTDPVRGLKKVLLNLPDLLLLDVRIPGKDGFEICKELRADAKTKHLPIIMISVRAEEADVVIGLEMGADDYISKPFRKRELIARVKTVLRRKSPGEEAEVLEKGGLRVDFGRYAVTANKKQITLTPKEFELLGLFMKKEGRVLTRAAISEAVWGFEYTGSSRTIDVHVDQLRRKLGSYGTWIVGLKGVGYRFEAEED